KNTHDLSENLKMQCLDAAAIRDDMTRSFQIRLFEVIFADIKFIEGSRIMCRNIKTLHNFKPPATEEEIRASSIQFVRKLSGFSKPSKANEAVFTRAVEQVSEAARELLESLVATAPPRDREQEAAKARARTAGRFHSPSTPGMRASTR